MLCTRSEATFFSFSHSHLSVPFIWFQGFFSSSYVLSEPGATTPQRKDAASGKNRGSASISSLGREEGEADRVLAGSRSIGSGSGARRRGKPPEQRTYLSQQTVHSAKPSLGCQRSDRRGSHWVQQLTCQPPGLKQAAAAPTRPPPLPGEANPPSPRRFPTCSCLQQTRAERSHERASNPQPRAPEPGSRASSSPPPPSSSRDSSCDRRPDWQIAQQLLGFSLDWTIARPGSDRHWRIFGNAAASAAAESPRCCLPSRKVAEGVSCARGCRPRDAAKMREPSPKSPLFPFWAELTFFTVNLQL